MDATHSDTVMPDVFVWCMLVNLLLPICVADRPPARVKQQQESTLAEIYESTQRSCLAKRQRV
jgi:hypothetical protein